MSRDVDDCPHRRRLPITRPSTKDAECRLLHEISGVADAELLGVDRDICGACLDELPADRSALNPTLASLLYGLARAVVNEGGVAGCSSSRAAGLLQLAEYDLAYRSGNDNDTNADIESVRRNRSHSNPRPKIGLIGWNTRTGLGQLNRDLARHLAIDRWLIPVHPYFAAVPERPNCRVFRMSGSEDFDAFLEGSDILLFCEKPPLPAIVPMARRSGIRVACVAMWEYLDEAAPWLRLVDLMICPTRICLDVAIRLRERLGLRFEVEMVPWPIDIDRFPFRRRTTCERFLFINGNGGVRERESRRPRWDGRKGVGLIAEAARLAPDVPILVRSQTDQLPPFPSNVEVRIGDVDDPANLYLEGDVCVQPSRWEGLGLPMLECQASGMPLITTDAPPMNEHHPLRVVPGKASAARLAGSRPIRSVECDPEALVRILIELHRSDIGEASSEARRFVESTHSWSGRAPSILEILASQANRTSHDRG